MSQHILYRCESCATEAEACEPADHTSTSHGVPGIPANWLSIDVIRWRGPSDDPRLVAELERMTVCSFECAAARIEAARTHSESDRSAIEAAMAPDR